ncbi:MAG: IS4 family transposase [Planctomycetes bacterium]|nr:IS4 family transposase [Planctomycetota bacterium]
MDPQVLYARHGQSVRARAAEHKVLLAVSDTTELDYTDHPQTAGLGPLSDVLHHGMFFHPTLVVTPERVPLGVIDAHTWVRDVDQLGKKKAAKREVNEKESEKWLISLEAAESFAQDLGEATTVIAVFDREGDTYDVLATARLPGRRSQILVRSQVDRRIDSPERRTRAHLEAQPVACSVGIRVPRKEGQKARTAELALRFAKVTMLPPKDRPASQGWLPVEITAVLAREEDPPKDQEAIEWLLFTTVDVNTAEDAFQVVRWYTCRWLIEILFKVLKSGCQAEERQLETAERLRRCLVFDVIVAYRILYLTTAGRDTPDLPCTVLFEEAEWKALYVFVNRSRAAIPKEVPTLREVTRILGRLGGHLGRKSDGEPGVVTMWRGLQRLPDITEMWTIWEETSAADGP